MVCYAQHVPCRSIIAFVYYLILFSVCAFSVKNEIYILNLEWKSILKYRFRSILMRSKFESWILWLKCVLSQDTIRYASMGGSRNCDIATDWQFVCQCNNPITLIQSNMQKHMLLKETTFIQLFPNLRVKYSAIVE